VLDIKCITSKKNPIFLATVVGKPPLEDKYMGYPTERLFLPLLQITTPDLIDYYMPENGVFHNLILAKISPRYPSHSKQIMHALWGMGQMSFVKHAIFVNDDAPSFSDSDKISDYILNRFSKESMLISYGVCDALDHSSPIANEGGKLGIDVTQDINKKFDFELIEDNLLLSKLQDISKDIINTKQYKKHTKNPICIISINKTCNQKDIFDKISILNKNIRIVIVVDDKSNNINYPYMLIWRIVNNIDAQRDIYIYDDNIFVDATNKDTRDNFNRVWPDDVICNKDIINNLIKNDLIKIDDKFIKEFGIY
jgi:4-hydroxy-3-polyprenylbenzoate decarboxylase